MLKIPLEGAGRQIDTLRDLERRYVCVFVCVCARADACERGSALTPLRGGLVRDSMETLSDSVSVREREESVEGES